MGKDIDFKFDLLLSYAMDGNVVTFKDLLEHIELKETDIFVLVGSSVRRYITTVKNRENMFEIINHILDQDYVNINTLIENKDDMMGKLLVEELKKIKAQRRNNLIDKII